MDGIGGIGWNEWNENRNQKEEGKNYLMMKKYFYLL